MITFRRFAIAFFAVLAALAPSSAQLPACYHSPDEIEEFIFALQAANPGLVRVDSIGHSRGDQLGRQFPIYAVKFSDNADVFENEPTALIIGHIHAEEVIGLEESIEFMSLLVSGQYNTLLSGTQIYFIPTMNPDGLQVIHHGIPMGGDTLWDNTWRKNGYVPPQLAGCNVFPGSGNDSCGVDLNRNFELNWLYGDTLWRPAGCQPFDYYRGPSPFSEPEARAVRDFARQIRPSLSIVYHSSRGCNHNSNIANQAIAPWTWGPDPSGPYKYPPDSAAISRILDPYASLLLSRGENIGQPYSRVMGGTHNGCLQDWFYQSLGCIQILTELGPPYEIQPPCNQLALFAQQDRPSLDWMLRRMINYGEGWSTTAKPVKVTVRDASSGLPVPQAEWRNMTTWTPLLGKWLTNEHGSAWFHPPIGAISIMARKEGYVSAVKDTSVSPGSGVRNVDILLEPLPWYSFTALVRDGSGNPVAGSIYLDGEHPKWVTVPAGGAALSLPQGTYRATVIPDDGNLAVRWHDITLTADMNFDVTCPTVSVQWQENFENGLTNWTAGGSGNNWRLAADTTTFMFGQSLTTTPATCPVWPCVYANNANTSIQYNATFNSGPGNMAFLKFFRRGRMDVPTDSLLVEVSTDNQNWVKVAGYCDLDVPWAASYVDLSAWEGVDLHLRFRLISDGALAETGMFIDDLRILGATDLDTERVTPVLPYSYRIASAYPNPFNPATTIAYEVAAPGAVQFGIYNVTGQEVRRFDVHAPSAGAYRLEWDGTNNAGASVPTGLYFVQLRAQGHTATHKLMLLR